MRLERLADKREQLQRDIQQDIWLIEQDSRACSPAELERLNRKRAELREIETEIIPLADDIERIERSMETSRLLRRDDDGYSESSESPVHRTFAQFARDQLIVHDKVGPTILSQLGGDPRAIREEAQERLERTLQNVTSTTVSGLVVPTHMTDILDIIDKSRPVVESARRVPLDRGSMTYPIIGTRPTVVEQTSEKTEAGTIAPTVSSGTLTAKTYLGATDVSWQAVNWSSPDVLDLYFQLAGEAYARQTEAVACEALETSTIGTVGTASGRLGTAGTESFSQWRTAVVAGLQSIYTATSGRHRTNTLYLSANRFYQLAALGTDQVAQMAPIGELDVGSMKGRFFGLDVVGSHSFDQDTAIVGDSSALLVGENAGNPVEMRVIEPSIGGYEVGLIGAFAAVVFDANRFAHLGSHL